jgi:hypothetical protein
VVAVPVAVDVGAPRVAFGVVPDALDAGLAVGSDTVVPARLLLGDDLQVDPSAVQSVVVEEDDLPAGRRLYDLAMQGAEAVLAIDLSMADSIPSPAAALGLVAPAEAGEERIIFVIDESCLALGKWDLLHWKCNLRVVLESPSLAGCWLVPVYG